MPATYEPIATTTLGTAASTITFSSIPSTYTDLRIVLAGSVTGNCLILLRFNNLATTIYSTTNLNANGATVGSARGSNQNSLSFNYSIFIAASQPFLATADVFSYAGSTNKTTLLTSQNDLNGSGAIERNVGLWRDTSAINRLDIITSANTLAAGTTATLYGILKA